MVYKKYITRGGKKYGPYLYENKRVNGKVVTNYLGMGKENKNYFFHFILLLFLVLFLVLYFNHSGQITGNAGGDEPPDVPEPPPPSESGGGTPQPSPTEISESSDAVSNAEKFVENSNRASGNAKSREELIKANWEIQGDLEKVKLELEKAKKLLEKYPNDKFLLENFLIIEENLESLKNILEEVNKNILKIVEGILGENKLQAKWEIKRDIAENKNSEDLKSKEKETKDFLLKTFTKGGDVIDISKEEGDCKYPALDSLFSGKVPYGENGKSSEVISSDGTNFMIESSCVKPKTDVNVIPGTEPGIVKIKDLSDNPPLAEIEYSQKISVDKPAVKIKLGMKSVLLSPSTCYNAVLDDLEEGIDCGGDCENCKESIEFKFPWGWWILLVFSLGVFFYSSFYGGFVIKRCLKKGKKYISEKDFKGAIGIYSLLRDNYLKLNPFQKQFYRQSCLEYYLVLKKGLSGSDVPVGKPRIENGNLPFLNYGDVKVGLKKIGNSDFNRIEKLLDDVLKELKKGKMRHARIRKTIIVEMYSLLDNSNKRKINKKYKKYLKLLN